ncbi:hypothetical protein [Bradyrhizobium sp. 25ACV]
MTLGNNTNRLCIGDHARPGDIGCLTWTPSLITAGDLTVSDSVMANKFVGDGSGLTNVGAASTDRITGGTTSMLAISSTGYVSLTQSGVNTPAGLIPATISLSQLRSRHYRSQFDRLDFKYQRLVYRHSAQYGQFNGRRRHFPPEQLHLLG